MTALTEWESFYVIVGSSAGARIGFERGNLRKAKPVYAKDACGANCPSGRCV